MDRVLGVSLELDRSFSGEPDDLLDTWHVSLVESLYDEAVDDYEPHATLASGVFYVFDPEIWRLRGERPFDVADAHSGDTAYYYGHVYDVGGELLEDVVDHFQPSATPALFVDDVRVPEAHRRQGYASALVAETLLTLKSTAVFAHPGPTSLTDGENERFRFLTENTRWLAHLGFEPFRDQLWTLDLALQEPIERLTRLTLQRR